VLLGPVSPRTWRDFASLLASLGVSGLFGALLICALAAWLTGLTGFALLVVALPRRARRIAGFGVVLWSFGVAVAARLTGLDRARIRRVAGIPIDAAPWPGPASGLSFSRRQPAWRASPVVRRRALYQLARLPVIVAILTAVSGISVLVDLNLTDGFTVGPFPIFGIESYTSAVDRPIGIVCVFVLPLAVRLGSRLDVVLARALLGPSRTGQLSAEVEHLGTARALAVESAESERRRIERDLHDGLQPKLVSLALELGLARSRFERDPDYARSLLDRAHEEAKTAIQDLRGLVRGIHPSVLDERGLDAALSALVASCAVPVRADVALTRRPDRASEAVAYFVAAESITNVTKHSGATTASVTITDETGLLRVLVQDDGKGDARIEPGGGLAGLAARVAAIDGTFAVTSPPGGPTLVEAVIPCER
jgi:signal transduction histidine kinase